MSITRINTGFSMLPKEIQNKLLSIGKTSDLSHIFVNVHLKNEIKELNRITIDPATISHLDLSKLSKRSAKVLWGIDKYTGLYLILRYKREYQDFNGENAETVTKYTYYALYQREANSGDLSMSDSFGSLFLNPNDRDFFERFDNFLTNGLQVKINDRNYKVQFG